MFKQSLPSSCFVLIACFFGVGWTPTVSAIPVSDGQCTQTPIPGDCEHPADADDCAYCCPGCASCCVCCSVNFNLPSEATQLLYCRAYCADLHSGCSCASG